MKHIYITRLPFIKLYAVKCIININIYKNAALYNRYNKQRIVGKFCAFCTLFVYFKYAQIC